MKDLMEVMVCIAVILTMLNIALLLIGFIRQESWRKNYRPGDPRPLDYDGNPIGELMEKEDVSP